MGGQQSLDLNLIQNTWYYIKRQLQNSTANIAIKIDLFRAIQCGCSPNGCSIILMSRLVEFCHNYYTLICIAMISAVISIVNVVHLLVY